MKVRREELVTVVPPHAETITIEANFLVVRYLKELVATGLYGATPADAALRLIERGIEESTLVAADPE